MIEILHGERETIVYDNNIAVRAYLNKETENYPTHWQPSFEVIMPKENIYTVYIEERKVVLYPNEILFIAPGVLHRIEAPQEGEREILLFDPNLIQKIPGLDSLSTALYPFVYYSNQNKQIILKMNQYMDNIYKIKDSTDSLKYACIYSEILQLTLLALKNKTNNFIKNKNGSEEHCNKYINKFLNVCDYINTNCSENITISQLADIYGFSESHFIRLFKQFTNITYHSYLNQCRINKAKQLLTTNPILSITEISYQTGFNSIATFNRVFKQHAKFSPTQYRNLLTIK
ncbi:MAG: helix-turn-helix transcriptional regulator [Peptostreptococcaceae bacterium]|nr:helix-turn-helix transcriptional regulator [Peptostreptococcaceae bacterium]